MMAPDSGDTVAIGPESLPDEAAAIVRAWVDDNVPQTWRTAAGDGPEALRAVRSREAYTAWYPILGRSGLVVPAWPREYGGLGVSTDVATAIERVLAPYRLHRLNPLGLNNTAAALFAFGTEDQRRRFLPPIVRNEERWCQLFSEPGAGSDLASLACRAVRDGDEWVLDGQKVWTTWAHESDFAIVLARTDPNRPKRHGITYLLLDLRQPGVEIRPLRQITGEAEFNEVFLDNARVPDTQRVGAENEGWKVSAATLSSERQMVSGSGSGGIGRLGGSSAEQIIQTARRLGRWTDPLLRQRLVALWSEERIRGWTNARVGAGLAAGQAPGPAASIGKVHQATLNQRLQAALVDLLGAGATAWAPAGSRGEGPEAYAAELRPEVNGMLRSRANSIEGGTTEINKNIVGERVLGLPREPDPWHGRPWSEVPRS
jgi:alkylation response protein AidB-like acyl-CoA dehydrogenase